MTEKEVVVNVKKTQKTPEQKSFLSEASSLMESCSSLFSQPSFTQKLKGKEILKVCCEQMLFELVFHQYYFYEMRF